MLQTVDATLLIPQEILSNIQEDSDVSIVFTVYNETSLFPVRQNKQDTGTPNTVPTNTLVNSQVVSATVAGIADGTRLSSPIKLTLKLRNVSRPGANYTTSVRKCAFWDFNAASKFKQWDTHHFISFFSSSSSPDGSGDWNTSGCTLTNYDDTTNMVTCACDHLTNFACLVVSISDHEQDTFTCLLHSPSDLSLSSSLSFSLSLSHSLSLSLSFSLSCLNNEGYICSYC